MAYRLVFGRALFGALVSAAVGGSAGATTYVGSQTVGSTTAVYRLDTDGTRGIVRSANLLDGSGSVMRGADTASFVRANNLQSSGDGLRAVGRLLLWDTESTDAFILGNNRGSGANNVFTGVCFGSSGISCGGNFPARQLLVAFAYERDFEIAPYSGIVLVGTAAVPEPGVWAMLVIGFGGIGAGLRRRRDRPAALVPPQI